MGLIHLANTEHHSAETSKVAMEDDHFVTQDRRTMSRSTYKKPLVTAQRFVHEP
jgi:hypothetical protein